MVTVQFNFKTILEAQEFLAGLSGGQQVSGPVSSPVSVPDSLFKDSATVAHPAAPALVTAGLQGTGLPDVIYSIEDCRTALSNLFDVKGREVAKSVLTEFKVDRVTYLKPEQFAAFIGRCEAAGKPE